MNAHIFDKLQLAQDLILKMKIRYPQYQFSLQENSGLHGNDIHINIYQKKQLVLSCSIDTIYNAYLKSPKHLDEACEQLLLTLEDFTSIISDKTYTILPMVVTRRRLLEIQQNHLQDKHAGVRAGDVSTPYVHLVANLFIVFAFDSSQHIYYPTMDQLMNLFHVKNTAQLREITTSNLKEKLPFLKINKSPLGATLELDGTYDPSMLLIFDDWKHKLPFSAAPVISMATQDTIMLVDSNQYSHIQALKKMLHETLPNLTDMLSKDLFTIYNGHLQLVKDI